MDCISNLPEEIIHHHIMSRLTILDIARTSCLSKAWKTYGVSHPYLNIDKQELERYGALHHGWFKDFMERKVRSMSLQKESLDVFKFKLCLDRALIQEAIDEIERCIKLIFEARTIKDFELRITDNGNQPFICFRPCIFFHHIYNAETLNVLKLSGLTLEQPHSEMKLPSLQILSLENVKIYDRQIDIGRFFTSCPMIRIIRLVNIRFLEHLKVSSLNNLKELEIGSCHWLESVEIQAPSLQKLVLSEIKRTRENRFILDLKIDSQTCKALRELTLCNSTIRGFTFSRLFSGCTNIESLVLDRCKHFFKIKIASLKLKKLIVARCFDLLKTDIDAPSLTSFTFCNYLPPDNWQEDRIPPLQCKKIIHQQECLLDFSYMLLTKSIWISLWFDKFKDIQGQKMVIYPKRVNKCIIILEDWSSMAELGLMNEICEGVAKTTITTMNFLDLVEYVLETNSHNNDLEKVFTISSTDESKFYEGLMKRKHKFSCNSCVAVAKTEVVAFLSGRCSMPWFSDQSFIRDNDFDGGLSYQALCFSVKRNRRAYQKKKRETEG